jgi:hypothetical protein
MDPDRNMEPFWVERKDAEFDVRVVEVKDRLQKAYTFDLHAKEEGQYIRISRSKGGCRIVQQSSQQHCNMVSAACQLVVLRSAQGHAMAVVASTPFACPAPAGCTDKLSTAVVLVDTIIPTAAGVPTLRALTNVV